MEHPFLNKYNEIYKELVESNRELEEYNIDENVDKVRIAYSKYLGE